MSRTITVHGTDRTALIRLDSMVFVESANRGEVGLGGYVMDDTAMSLDVPALKVITVLEDAASPTRLHTGHILDRAISRGDLPLGRQWDVMVSDLNDLLDDNTIGGGVNAGNRPAESDYDRITWLLSTSAMTNNVGDGVVSQTITAGQVPNTNTVNLDAVDHTSSKPRDVLDECSTASGKNFFLYNWGSGNKLYYDRAKATAAGTTSALRISSVAADVDNTTTFAPIGDPGLRKLPIDVYSNVRFVYSGGVQSVTSAGTVVADFRRRVAVVTDTQVTSATKAAAKGAQYLSEAATETTQIDGLRILVGAQYVNDIRAGMRLEIKLPHLGYAAFTYARCTRREVRPARGGVGFSDVMYEVTLNVADDVKPTKFSQNDPKKK